MIAKDLIIEDFPFLSPEDTGNKALDIMENFMISHLVVVENNTILGLISMDDIYNFDLFETKIKNYKNPLIRTFVYDFQHIFNVLKALNILNITVVPVINSNEEYIGTITQNSLLKSISNILCVKEEGYIFVINLNILDFSATEICNLVEKNDGKILSLYIDDNKNSSQITVYLKIQIKDPEAVQQSFDRYEYNYKLLNKFDNEYDEMYKERLDNFLNYLNI